MSPSNSQYISIRTPFQGAYFSRLPIVRIWYLYTLGFRGYTFLRGEICELETTAKNTNEYLRRGNGYIQTNEPECANCDQRECSIYSNCNSSSGLFVYTVVLMN